MKPTHSFSFACRHYVIAMAILLLPTGATGQAVGSAVQDLPSRLNSGSIDNLGDEFLVVPIGSVRVPGAHWVRVHFGNYELRAGSYITLTSTQDRDTQRFDARSLPDWYNWSAMFRGEEVEVALYVAPGDLGVFFEVDATRTPLPQGGGEPDLDRSICGANDDRVASTDPRVGRITTSTNSPYCTGWLVTNGAVLTAGHCAPIGAGDLLEFNVPASTANGNTNPASAANQYPINVASVNSQNIAIGQDWMVFGLNANSTTGLRAHVVQGYFRMVQTTPANGTTIRVTGYGLDNSPAGTGGVGANCCDPDGTGPMGCGNNCNSTNQTEQTATGAYAGLAGSTHSYAVDTMPANSGSPIIWNAFDVTIGIHTNGGCTSGGGNNRGTAFALAALRNGLQGFPGPLAVFVDGGISGLPQNGGIFEPYVNMSQAASGVANGGIISIVAGSYPPPITLGTGFKAMRLEAPVGTVRIGG